jgi:ATP synthase F1 complex assembly factor 1
LFSSPRRPYFSNPVPRNLNDVLKLELCLTKSGEEIKGLWDTYFARKPGIIASTYEKKEWDLVSARAAECPFFVVPVFRGENYFVMVAQFQEKNLMFTDLAAYQQNANAAMPWLSTTFYTELHKPKQVVLYRMDITSQHITREEAVFSLATWKLYYEQDEFFAQVRQFNKDPNNFNFDKFIQTLKKERAGWYQ